MSIHKVNIDAIALGASAFILNWPTAPEGPTKVPRGAHKVLWADDFWRGADMAREVLRDTFGRAVWDAWHRDDTNPPPYARATIYMVACRMTNGQVTKVTAEAADHDLVETLEEALANLCKTGDPDRRDEHAWNCDHEVELEADAEA